jgi:putative SOS response-associated peptidase YedK
MCGRIIQATGPVNLAIVDALDVRDHRLDNFPRRYNGAPSQDLLVIRENHKTGERTLEPLRWGLIPYWCKDPKGGRRRRTLDSIFQRRATNNSSQSGGSQSEICPDFRC